MPREGDIGVVVREAFEREGLSAEEIAQAFGFDVGLVREVLRAGSAEYRARRALEGEDVYSVVEDAEFERVKAAYKAMLLEDENTPAAVRERGLRWLMEEKLGRNKKEKGIPGLTLNIVRVNERLESLSSRKEQLLRAITVDANPAPTPAP